MTESTYSTTDAADDAAQYAIAQSILADDPDDADAKATVRTLNRRYGAGFFED